MKFSLLALTSTLFAVGSSAQESKRVRGNVPANRDNIELQERQLSGGAKKGGPKGAKGGGSCRGGDNVLALKVINLTRAQPFARDVFVMVHDDLEAGPLFEYGGTADEALKLLAERGDATDLVTKYEDDEGVAAIRIYTPIGPGATAYLDIDEVGRDYPYVTMGAMFVHSNDGFAAINGEYVSEGDVLELNGLDAGTEFNTELCEDIPGPACTNPDGSPNTNGRSGGDDVPDHIRVHPGFFGLGDDGEGGEPRLTAPRYTWLNPMLRVEVVCVDESLISVEAPAMIL